MIVAPMGEVRNNLTKYLRKCEEEPVFVTRNGKITAVLEHMRDVDVEDYLLERSPRFRAMLEKVGREGDGMTLAEYRKSRGVRSAGSGTHFELLACRPGTWVTVVRVRGQVIWNDGFPAGKCTRHMSHRVGATYHVWPRVQPRIGQAERLGHTSGALRQRTKMFGALLYADCGARCMIRR
jgi:hypothetical protein